MIQKFNQLKQQHGFIKYFKNTFWLLAEKTLRITIGLFVGIWVARYLGPEEFGLFSYALSYVAIFTIFSTLGLDSIVVKRLLKNDLNPNILLGTSFIMKLIGFIIMFLFILLSLKFINSNSSTSLIISIISLSVVFQSFNILDIYFQSKVLSKYVVFANTISLFISSIIKIILILLDAPLVAFATVTILDSIIIAIGLIYYYKLQGQEFKHWKFNFNIAKELLYESWPMIISGVAISLYMKVDQVMISNIMSNTDVGYYAVAVKFSEIWLFITVAITNSLFPAIINAKKESEKKYTQRMLYLYRVLTFIAIIISLFIYIFSDYIILYTYGIQYKDSIVLLQLYVWSIVFVFLNNASWKWYIIEGIQKIAMIRLLLGAFINIILNMLWIDEYGLIGAVYATLISYSIATYFGNLLSRKTIKNFKMQTYAIFTFYKIKDFHV